MRFALRSKTTILVLAGAGSARQQCPAPGASSPRGSVVAVFASLGRFAKQAGKGVSPALPPPSRTCRPIMVFYSHTNRFTGVRRHSKIADCLREPVYHHLSERTTFYQSRQQACTKSRRVVYQSWCVTKPSSLLSPRQPSPWVPSLCPTTYTYFRFCTGKTGPSSASTWGNTRSLCCRA